jgi:Ca2+-binding RTX toxin-like protein
MVKLYSSRPVKLGGQESLLFPFRETQGPEVGHGSHIDSDQGDGDKPDAQLGTNAADLLVGSPGSDHLVGLNGIDTLQGLQGKDWLYGNNGHDFLEGGEGRDFLHGGNGDDELYGGSGRDDLFGENGNDLLIGGSGPDLMEGGRGDDVLFGGNAPDTYTGGLGRDIFVLSLPGGDGGHGGGGGGEDFHTLSPLAEEEEGDVITDFRQGVDQLGLAAGLTFDQLAFEGNRIYVVTDDDSGPVTLASPSTQGSDHEGPGRLLATLIGFDTTQLGQADFVAWSDLSMG